ncbi:MAG: proton-conducting transporter membrane subunit [Lachnospiraceae bacterium]|nr:proton-conducting transporter membrane subunit [Lachnospiraceae bacterium]
MSNIVYNLPLFTIIPCLFSGVLCLVLNGKTARRYTMLLECVLIVLVSIILWYTVTAGTALTYPMGEFPAPWGNEIRAGALEALIALLFLIVMFCSVLGGFHFVDLDIDESKINLYYALINLMTAALMAMTWTNDVFTGYVFLEILTLSSCGVLIVREIGRTTLAAIRYMILNLLGSGLFLLGIVLLYDVSGHLLMLPMQETLSVLAEDPQVFTVVTLATGILTIGLGIKSGLFPFHFWMPDTYGMSTPTSASVLSALVSKCYLFLLIKIYYRAVGITLIERMPLKNVLFVLGICGMIFGSISALRANHVNKMVAFSSAAQIGYIYMGIGIGGTAGYTAAIFQIFAHSVTKSMLFLTTPRLAAVSGESLLFKQLQGSGLRDKNAGLFFTLGALSMIGIPIFAGFSAKLLFGVAAVETVSLRKMILVILALAVSSLLNALYFIRTMIRIYTGHDKTVVPFRERPVRNRISYNVPMLILLAGNLFLGLMSGTVVSIITKGLEMFS